MAETLTTGSDLELEAVIADVPVIFGATIVAVTGEMVTVRVIAPRGTTIPLTVGTVVRGDVIERGTIRSFDSTVLARTRQHGGVHVTLEAPSVFREEHRGWFRFPYELAAAVRVWDADAQVTRSYAMATLDIGGGGIGVVAPLPVPVGATATIVLQLGEGGPSGRGSGETGDEVRAAGVVVRSTENGTAVPVHYRLGIVFEKIDPHDRQRLIQFIFERQRELRQQGRL